MYKSEITKNRKNLNYDNNIVIVESNEIANSLKPLTIYQWVNHSNINLRQFNKNQFGDLIFNNVTEAIKEKSCNIKELESNKKQLIKDIKTDIKYNRHIRTIKNNIKNECMNNNYFTVKTYAILLKSTISNYH